MQKYLLAGALTMAVLGWISPVDAQPNQGSGSFVGRVPATPGCPAVEMHIIRQNTIITGIVFYPNGSGVSRVSGQFNGNAFSWQDTPIEGKGPTSTVTGTLSPDGRLRISRSGTSCSWETTLSLLSEGGIPPGSG